MNEFWVNMIGGIVLFAILFAIVYGCSIDVLVATKSKKNQWIFVLVSLSIFALLILICGIQYNNQKVETPQKAQQALQETTYYDMLQNRLTGTYEMIVLDGETEKYVRYHPKKKSGRDDYYLYYRVKPDLSYQEVPITETPFPPVQYENRQE